MEKYDTIEELSDFLGGIFHQDMESPEKALEEFILEASEECLQFTVEFCEKFLSSSLTNEEKENFIKSNAEIYFPSLGLTPVQWLKDAVKKVKESLDTLSTIT